MKTIVNIILAVIVVLSIAATVLSRGILPFICLMVGSGAVAALLELNGNHVTRY